MYVHTYFKYRFFTVPSSSPRNVMVTTVNPASLIVSWQPPPVIDHNGPLTGHNDPVH